MSATYERSGVSLAYPENWTLEEDTDEEARLNLTISSPNTAFWTLIVYSETLDLAHVVEQAMQALREEYPDLETSDAPESVAGHTLAGQDATFFCLELTSTARIRACHRGASTWLIFSQAEDRELERVAPVLQAITHSLLTGAESLAPHLSAPHLSTE